MNFKKLIQSLVVKSCFQYCPEYSIKTALNKLSIMNSFVLHIVRNYLKWLAIQLVAVQWDIDSLDQK